MTQGRRHRRENLPQMRKLQIHNHPLQKTSPHLHSNHKVKPSLNSNQKMNPSWSSNHKMIPFLNSNHKTSPFLNNNNTLLIHLHLNPAMTVHFQIMAQLSNCLQQKIPVPYQRNRDTVYIRNLNRFNQFCLISLYRSQRNTSHILGTSRNIYYQMRQNFQLPVIYSLKCILLSLFSTNQTH